jgi:hypothetical protein
MVLHKSSTLNVHFPLLLLYPANYYCFVYPQYFSKKTDIFLVLLRIIIICSPCTAKCSLLYTAILMPREIQTIPCFVNRMVLGISLWWSTAGFVFSAQLCLCLATASGEQEIVLDINSHRFFTRLCTYVCVILKIKYSQDK